MAQLDRLIRDARNAMQAHHHIPMPAERWHEESSKRSGARIQCVNCTMDTTIICKPRPNGTYISGKAIAMNCNVATRQQFERVLQTVPPDNEIRMDAVFGC